MQSNETRSETPLNERETARARLAWQVGQLLANEWLRNCARDAERRSPRAVAKIRGRQEPNFRVGGPPDII
jgi:hypothetical protein